MNEKEFDVIQSVALVLEKKKYLGRLYEASDLYVAGWEAVEEFHNKHPGSTDENLLAFIIRRRMIDHVRILRRSNSENPIFNALNFSDLPEVYDMAQSMTDNGNANFEEIIKIFRPKEQHMLRMYFEADMCYREIAEIMDIHESRVCQLFKQDIFPLIRETMSLTTTK